MPLESLLLTGFVILHPQHCLMPKHQLPPNWFHTDFLNRLPPSIQHLRLLKCTIALHYVLASLRLRNTMPSLLGLTLSPVQLPGAFNRGPIGDETLVEDLEELCAGRGIELVWAK